MRRDAKRSELGAGVQTGERVADPGTRALRSPFRGLIKVANNSRRIRRGNGQIVCGRTVANAYQTDGGRLDPRSSAIASMALAVACKRAASSRTLTSAGESPAPSMATSSPGVPLGFFRFCAMGLERTRDGPPARPAVALIDRSSFDLLFWEVDLVGDASTCLDLKARHRRYWCTGTSASRPGALV